MILVASVEIRRLLARELPHPLSARVRTVETEPALYTPLLASIHGTWPLDSQS